MDHIILEKATTRVQARRRRILRRRRKHRVKSAKLRIAAKIRSRRITPGRRRKIAKKGLRTKRKFYGNRLRSWLEIEGPVLQEQFILEKQNLRRNEMSIAQALIEKIRGGSSAVEALRDLKEEEATDKAAKLKQGLKDIASKWGSTAIKTGIGVGGAYLLGKGSYKAGKLAGSVGRKAAFLKGFGLGNVTGSAMTAGASLLHKGAQQAGREAALSKYVHGTAQVPSFSFRDLQGSGGYSNYSPHPTGFSHPPFGGHPGIQGLPRRPFPTSPPYPMGMRPMLPEGLVSHLVKQSLSESK